MAYRIYGALIASVSAAALMLVSNETFARGGGVAAAAPHAGFVAPHPVFRPNFHPNVARAFRHHRGRNFGAFWWPGADDFYGTPYSEPLGEVTPPASTDIRYTYTYDVPWDWAHRFPPNVTPSDRPYVSSCPSETVTVPGRGGTEQTVNVMRCY